MLPLVYIFPIFMKIILLIIFGLFIYNLKYILKIFKPIKRSVWFLLLLIFLCGFIIRMFYITHTHQAYSDEFSHINIAQNILYSNKFCQCINGTNKDCQSCFLFSWPPGYHTFLSIMFSLFGDSEQVAFNCNAVIGSISIIVFFLLVFLITKKDSLALIGSFMFNLIPVHLIHSGSSALGIFSVFFILLCMVMLEIYIHTKKYSVFLLFLTVLLYAVHIRPENFIIIPLFIFYLFIKLGKSMTIFISRKYLISTFIFVLMLIPLIQLLYFDLTEYPDIGYSDPLTVRIYNFHNNMISNIGYLFNSNFTPFVLSVLVFIGFLNLFFKNKKQLCYYLLFIFLFLAILSHARLNQGGSRFSLLLYLPLIIIAVYGLDSILIKLSPNIQKIIIFAILIVYVVSSLHTNWFIHTISGEFEEEYEFILSSKDKLPQDVDIITYNSVAIISSIHKRAVYTDLFIDTFQHNERKKNIILFKDIGWYKREEELKKFSNELKENYKFETIVEEGRWGFYNLTLK